MRQVASNLSLRLRSLRSFPKFVIARTDSRAGLLLRLARLSRKGAFGQVVGHTGLFVRRDHRSAIPFCRKRRLHDRTAIGSRAVGGRCDSDLVFGGTGRTGVPVAGNDFGQGLAGSSRRAGRSNRTGRPFLSAQGADHRQNQASEQGNSFDRRRHSKRPFLTVISILLTQCAALHHR